MGKIIENGNYCVYIHTSPSGKMYVGQTGKLPEERWGKNGSHYLKKEKSGEYMHQAFAHAILKYGWDNIKHEIVSSNLTKEEADNLEKLLIEKLNTKNRKHGYNLKDGGLGGGGFSEETLKKMSEVHKGIKQSEETIRKRIEKLKGENNPNYGKPMSEKQRKKISDSKKGENNHMYGKHFDEETKRKIKESQKTRKVAQYDLQGNLIKVWDSISDAGRELCIIRANISACCRNKRRVAGGFIWRYYEEEPDWHNGKQVVQYSLSGEFICMFQSLAEASLITNTSYSGILSCCKGDHYTAGGYIWRYYDSIESVV